MKCFDKPDIKHITQVEVSIIFHFEKVCKTVGPLMRNWIELKKIKYFTNINKISISNRKEVNIRKHTLYKRLANFSTLWNEVNIFILLLKTRFMRWAIQWWQYNCLLNSNIIFLQNPPNYYTNALSLIHMIKIRKKKFTLFSHTNHDTA